MCITRHRHGVKSCVYTKDSPRRFLRSSAGHFFFSRPMAERERRVNGKNRIRHKKAKTWNVEIVKGNEKILELNTKRRRFFLFSTHLRSILVVRIEFYVSPFLKNLKHKSRKKDANLARIQIFWIKILEPFRKHSTADFRSYFAK